MSLLEPMMAEEKNASSDGRDGNSRTVFVWGKIIMVNIEGEKQNIIPQQYKTNMTRGRAGHVTLPCEWGSKCGGVDQARTCTPLIYPRKKKSHFVEWGGGKGVFTVVSPKNGTACRLTTPLPPLLSGKNQRSPSTALHVPYPPPKNKPFVKWGGGNRGGSPWRCPRTTLQVAYPPLEKPTIRVMGGEGEGGVHRGIAQAWHCTSPIPPLPPPHVRDN